MKILYWFACLSLLFHSDISVAKEFVDKFTVNGFVAQGVIKAPHTNYVNDEGNASTRLTELGVSAAVQFTPDLHLAGQFTYQNNGNRHVSGGRLDYLFIEYHQPINAAWDARVQLGRYKNNHWLYSATRDTPHTRPSIILPQSKYYDGFRDVALSSDGVALQFNHWLDWGDIEMRWSRGHRDFSDDEQNILLSLLPRGNVLQDFVEQAGVYVTIPKQRLTLAMNYLDSVLTYHAAEPDLFLDGKNSFNQWMLALRYEGKKFEVVSELFTQKVLVNEFFFPGYRDKSRGSGAFLQTRYSLTPSLKLLARYDWYVRDWADKNGEAFSARTGIPSFFGYQHTWTVGTEWQLRDNLVLHVEAHSVKGTARLTPVIFPNPQINDQENWSILAAQLMWWF